MKTKPANKLFDALILIILLSAVLLCLFPFFHVISISLSSNHAILSNEVGLFPVDLNFQAYRQVAYDVSILKSLKFTILLTVIYTFISLAMTICCAYPLTKKRLKGRNTFMIIILLTMYFSGGMIPEYVLISKLGLIDNMWSLILPGMLSAYNMLILKTFFTGLPESLEESAYLDGCSDIGILIKIVLPLSTPVLATLALFYAVGRWNGFMDALMYVSKPTLQPLQLKLYNIIYSSMVLDLTTMEGSNNVELTPEGLKAATIMFATIPIILVYPRLQKYFVKGVMIGAIKG